MNATTQQYDLCVFIGRLSPPHKGHIATILEAFKHGKNVLVVLGTHNSPRTIKNPWTTQERVQMILNSIPLELHPRISFVGAEDYMYSDTEWLTEVTKSIRNVAHTVSGKRNPSIALIAHKKDDTTYYVNYFKFLDAIIPMHEVKVGDDDTSPSLSSTKIRELYFEGYLEFIKHVCPDGVYEFLLKFYKTETFKELKQEYDDAIAYQKMFENVPYGNSNFLTADSVVFQSGHVLLIKRKEAPGKGLWALPGGHVQNNETCLQGAIRELREETVLKVPEKVLRGSIFAKSEFDHPDRSLRCRVKGRHGRSVTMAYGFKLDDSEKLPHVKGTDDAEVARWIPIDIAVNDMRDQLFEDHHAILTYMAARVPSP